MKKILALKILQYGMIFFLFEVAFSDTEVTFVTRNVTDSFRIAEEDCRKDQSVCTNRNAVCQVDGSCLCGNTTQDYLNPKLVVVYGYLDYDTTDGCLDLNSITNSIDPDNLRCSHAFGPYQVIPSRPTNVPVTFIHEAGAHYISCNFSSALVKYPSRKSWEPVTWMNGSYVNINMTYWGYLDFAWKMPVPQLNGLIVIINFNCLRTEILKRYNADPVAELCLRAKVLGKTSLAVSGAPYGGTILLVSFLAFVFAGL